MKNGIIGSSGERLRSALSIIDAVSGGRSLWLATCNSIGSLPPELRRRFTLGTFFFDLPAADEREAIWQIYTSKYGVQDERPHDDNWTGAEIKECCRKAYRLRMSLRQSAEYTRPGGQVGRGPNRKPPPAIVGQVFERVASRAFTSTTGTRQRRRGERSGHSNER